MIYQCCLKTGATTMEIAIVHANNLEDLFWQLDEITSPYDYEIVKDSRVPIIQVHYELLPVEGCEDITEAYFPTGNVELTEGLLELGDCFSDYKKKYRFSHDTPYKLELIKEN